MQNQIPLPTDNIFKFYSLFGLLLFIFALGSTLYLNSSTNSLVFEALIEIEAVKAVDQPTSVDIAKRQMLERKMEIAVSDKKFFMQVLIVLTAIATLLMFYGFYKWHNEIQPVQDEISKLQRDKLKLEVAAAMTYSEKQSQSESTKKTVS